MDLTRASFDTKREQARRTASAAAALAARTFNIRALSASGWQVRSETGRRCRVSRAGVGRWACECPDFQSSGQARGLRCKHIEGVRLWLKHGQAPVEFISDERTVRMYHKVILVGNLGRDPEMRYTPGGKPVTNFTVATTEKWTGADGEPQERTAWWRVSAFGKLGEVCNEYLSTGQKVLVEGVMNPDPKTGGPHIWTAQDGEPRANYELKAMLVKFLGGGKNNATGAAVARASTPEPAVAEYDIPF